MTNQLIHTHIIHLTSSQSFYTTFIYAENSIMHRSHMLSLLPHFRQDTHPWIVFGDFNSSYLTTHKVGGPPLSNSQLSPLNNALFDSSLLEIPYSGSHFTWTNKCRHGTRTLTKIDHAFSNFKAFSQWPNLHTHIPEPMLSDHCPLILSFGEQDMKIKASFKFFDNWTNEHDFKNIVLQAWNVPCYGNPALIFQQKLKNTKNSLKVWATNKYG